MRENIIKYNFYILWGFFHYCDRDRFFFHNQKPFFNEDEFPCNFYIYLYLITRGN